MNNHSIQDVDFKDFKSITLYKKNLTLLTLGLMTQNYDFNLNYPFYDYFWGFVSLLLKKTEIQQDFGKLEALVEDQMMRKSSLKLDPDLIQQNHSRTLQFNL